MASVIARSVEIEVLLRLYNSQHSEFLALYGRRRIGKTFLVNRLFRDKGLYFEVTGTRQATTANQLNKYHQELSTLFPEFASMAAPKDWHEALHRLKEALSQVTQDKKVVLFFDELPWLATPKSGLLKELDYYWNRHFSRMNNVLLIICGSAASWMIKSVIRDKGGLYGRLSEQLLLKPFSLSEVEEYFQARAINLDRKQIVQLYMVMGGVAKYLSLVKRGLSTAQLVDQLCFSAQSSLVREFDDLYKSLFGKAKNHIAIVTLLAQHRNGMLRETLLNQLGLSSGGNISSVLKELEESGFILSFKKFGQRERGKMLRLVDEYSYFYLNFIAPIKSDILYGAESYYWQKVQASQRWKTWSGYAFESVCMKHIVKIKQALGIAGLLSSHSQWFAEGVQIDFLIDRADNCINLCETKFYDTEFVLSKEYAEKLQNKKKLFIQQTGTRKMVFITLITPYGCKINQHYLSTVDNQLTLDDLF